MEICKWLLLVWLFGNCPLVGILTLLLVLATGRKLYRR